MYIFNNILCFNILNRIMKTCNTLAFRFCTSISCISVVILSIQSYVLILNGMFRVDIIFLKVLNLIKI